MPSPSVLLCGHVVPSPVRPRPPPHSPFRGSIEETALRRRAVGRPGNQPRRRRPTPTACWHRHWQGQEDGLVGEGGRGEPSMSPSDKGIGSGPRWARRKQAPFRYLLEEDQPTSPSHTRPAAHSLAARPDPRFHISRTTFIAELCFLMMAQGTIDSTRWIFRHGMIKLHICPTMQM